MFATATATTSHHCACQIVPTRQVPACRSNLHIRISGARYAETGSDRGVRFAKGMLITEYSDAKSECGRISSRKRHSNCSFSRCIANFLAIIFSQFKSHDVENPAITVAFYFVFFKKILCTSTLSLQLY